MGSQHKAQEVSQITRSVGASSSCSPVHTTTVTAGSEAQMQKADKLKDTAATVQPVSRRDISQILHDCLICSGN